MKITEGVRQKNIYLFGKEWVQAEWIDVDGNQIFWRYQYGRLSATATVVGRWVIEQRKGKRFKSRVIQYELFRNEVSRTAINSALRKLEELNLIKKSNLMRGRNQEWIVK